MFQKYKIVFLSIAVLIIITGSIFAVSNFPKINILSNYNNVKSQQFQIAKHKDPIPVKYNLDQFESLSCGNYQIQPYGSYECDIAFKTNFPKENLGMVMVHWVDQKDEENVGMLGCDYKNPENQKILNCYNEIMFIQKGGYIAEISLSDQVKQNILDKTLQVKGDPLPYEITETVDIS